MKYLSVVLGIVILALYRVVFISVDYLIMFHGSHTGPHAYEDIKAAGFCGLFAMPVTFLLFKGKWPKIAVCTLTCGLIGEFLLIATIVINKLPVTPFSPGAMTSTLSWIICGFASSWTTVVISDSVEHKPLISRRLS